VRETGGLKDTVFPYNKYTGEGRGFTFTEINANDLLNTVINAVDVYANNKEDFKKLQIAGMTADFSWTNSAKQYLAIYRKCVG
jgi:starch synthase